MTVTVLGDVSGPNNPATSSVTITLLQLGDAKASGLVVGTDASYVNLYLGSNPKAVPSGVYNLDASLLDLYGSGVVTGNDASLINLIIGGAAIP